MNTIMDGKMLNNVRNNLKSKIVIFPLAAMTAALIGSCSGTKDTQNYGLSKPQDPATLPKSSVPYQKAVRKAKMPASASLKAAKDGMFSIRGGWELIESEKINLSGEEISQPGINTADWYNAVVPGTVLTSLVEQGVYPDPYFGLNNMSVTDSLCRKDWWYRASVNVPAEGINKNKWICFEGINYKAEIFLNGSRLGNIDGAFSRGIFDVSGKLNETGENILAVHIIPPPDPGIPHEESPSAGQGPNGGLLCLDGPTFISSEGWDWVPGIRDRNIGIWQDVNLKFAGPVTIKDPQVITDLPLPDTTKADVTIKTELFNSGTKVQKITLTGKISDVVIKKDIELKPGEKKEVSFTPAEFSQLRFADPKLWWPNGYGNQALYNLELKAETEGVVSDIKTERFGIREMSYEMTVDFPGIKGKRIEYSPVNDIKQGQPLFDNISRRDVGHGTAVPSLFKETDTLQLKEIEQDAMAPYLVIKVNGRRIFCKGGNWGMDEGMKRISREFLEPYFKLHKDAHFNMIRNWTGESTEDLFYSLADEYGLLVWNDFWMSTEGYNLPPLDNKLFLDNVKDVLKRFRNHPSIAVWCPRNEGYAPVTMEKDLASLIASVDGTRHYHANSRYMNLTPSGPWHYFKDPAEYFRSNARGFNTELGTPSVPTAVSMRKMMSEKDVWPISDVWYYHDLHFGQWDYRKAIDSLYGTATGLEDFCKKAQMINYESHRAMFESWNSRLWNNTSGILLWMTHPAWPSMVWQVYSWDYETFGSYYGSKKACEPVHIQMNLHDKKVSVINTSLAALKNVRAELSVCDLKGKQVYKKERSVDAEANRLTECFTPEFPSSMPDVYLSRLTLTDENGKLIS
ncbi:MAG: glycoside hydrolase family 2 protein, partial [Syntrophothermus sp.]